MGRWTNKAVTETIEVSRSSWAMGSNQIVRRGPEADTPDFKNVDFCQQDFAVNSFWRRNCSKRKRVMRYALSALAGFDPGKLCREFASFVLQDMYWRPVLSCDRPELSSTEEISCWLGSGCVVFFWHQNRNHLVVGFWCFLTCACRLDSAGGYLKNHCLPDMFSISLPGTVPLTMRLTLLLTFSPAATLWPFPARITLKTLWKH